MTCSAASRRAGAGGFEAAFAERDEQLQLTDAFDVLRLELSESLVEFIGGDDLRGLGLERGGDRFAQAEQTLGQAV